MSGPASFILASASPRRKQLLERAGYRFEVIPSRVDESDFDADRMNCAEAARQLALAKAEDVAAAHPDRLVMGADTVVDLDGRLIGKPADAADAEAIIRRLFSRPHKVITGLALVWIKQGIRIAETDTTIVYPRKMTEAQIAEHITGGTWEGKAGAYAIQETGDRFVERIEGSFTNVMGLPMELVEGFLGDLQICPEK
jgi:septum formation protein